MLDRIAQAVITGDEVTAPHLTSEAVCAGVPPRDVLNEGLLKGMTEVGRLFRLGEYYLPEVLVAAEAMKAGTAVLQPHLARAGVKPERTAVIGTVQGDLHDIGKNLVAIMLEGAGFAVVDLGVDVTPAKFVTACRKRRPDVVALSALLTTTMPMMETIIRRIKTELTEPPAVIVGGAPVTENYAAKIGASGYGADAATGAELAKRLAALQGPRDT